MASAARHNLKGSHGRPQAAVEAAKESLAALEPEYATLADAIKELVPDINAAIDRGHHVKKVYELVARKLKTTPTTVKSVIQREKKKEQEK